MSNNSNPANIAETVQINDYAPLHAQFCRFLAGKHSNERTYDARERGSRYWLNHCESTATDPYNAEYQDVWGYINKMNGELSDSAIGSRLTSTSIFYEWLHSDPNIDYEHDVNPTADINLRNDFGIKPNSSNYIQVLSDKGKDDIKALPKETIVQLFDHCGSPSVRNELLVRLMFQTAMRCDEISRVRCDSIDWDDREITIRSSKLNPDDHPQLYKRKVYWQPNLDYLMHRWYHNDREEHDDIADDSPYLFIGQGTCKLDPGYISRIVKNAGHRAGLQEPIGVDGNGHTRWLITGHRIRHSAISYWANETELELHHIRMLAGHSSLDTTMSYITTSWEKVRSEYEQHCH